MADYEQLQRAVSELENGVQWVKALADVAQLKQDTRDDLQKLTARMSELQDKEQQLQLSLRIISEQGQQLQSQNINELQGGIGRLDQLRQELAQNHIEIENSRKQIETQFVDLAARTGSDLQGQLTQYQTEISTQQNRAFDQLGQAVAEINHRLDKLAGQLESIQQKQSRRSWALMSVTILTGLALAALIIYFNYWN